MNISRPHDLLLNKPEFYRFFGAPSLLDAAQNIYAILRRTRSDHNFSLLCETSRSRVTVYVDPVGIDVINKDFLKWIEIQLRDDSIDSESPGFVSIAARNLLKSVFGTLKQHNFVGEQNIVRTEHFNYLGPFLDGSKIASYLEIAAQTTGISLELLKRFRDENPEELRYEMKRYFDTLDLGLCEW